MQVLILALPPEKVLDPLPEEAKVFPWVTYISSSCQETALPVVASLPPQGADVDHPYPDCRIITGSKVKGERMEKTADCGHRCSRSIHTHRIYMLIMHETQACL